MDLSEKETEKIWALAETTQAFNVKKCPPALLDSLFQF